MRHPRFKPWLNAEYGKRFPPFGLTSEQYALLQLALWLTDPPEVS